jgi:hypothetical protein
VGQHFLKLLHLEENDITLQQRLDTIEQELSTATISEEADSLNQEREIRKL